MSLVDSLFHTLETRPFDHLGLHPIEDQWIIRTWQPHAIKMEVYCYHTNKPIGTMQCEDERGLFTLTIDNWIGTYYLIAYYEDQNQHKFIDPYQFGERAFQDFEHLAYQQYKNLGAQKCQVNIGTEAKPVTLEGVRFAVYAPNARSVSLVGDFNVWNGNVTPMSSHQDGIWRIFIPEIQEGALYKYEIKDQYGQVLTQKSDPVGFSTEQYPSFASKVEHHKRYKWQDKKWQERAFSAPHASAINIYEVHAPSWKQNPNNDHASSLSWIELADQLVNYAVDMGYTHLELLPISEYPLDDSWGYQPLQLFSPTSRLGSMDDFKFFIDQCHQNNIGVILDWVPAHFPSDAHGLAKFDGTCIYEYEDSQKGWHPDWKSYIYDYGKTSVCDFLLSSALYWLDEFHIDGLRVDAVASMLYLDYSRDDGQWTPNVDGGNLNLEAIEFLKNFNRLVYQHFPKAITIAEESTAFPGVSTPIDQGGLGFGFKWNMGWMNDTLSYFEKDPIYRTHHYEQLCFGFVYCFDENFVLPLSHDEVVHGKGSILDKMPGDLWQKCANHRALAAWQFAHPGKKLNFMGNEFGQFDEWNFRQSLDWHLLEFDHHKKIKNLYQSLNHFYKSEKALYETDSNYEGFKWIERVGHQKNILAFARYDESGENEVIVIANLAPAPHANYNIGADNDEHTSASYEVIINTDDEQFGGSGFSKQTIYSVNQIAAQGYAHSICLNIPPLATLILKKK